MARGSKIVVNVKRSKNFSSFTIRTSGLYGALVTNSINLDVPSQPMYTTASEKAYWTAVLTAVQGQIAALP